MVIPPALRASRDRLAGLRPQGRTAVRKPCAALFTAVRFLERMTAFHDPYDSKPYALGSTRGDRLGTIGCVQQQLEDSLDVRADPVVVGYRDCAHSGSQARCSRMVSRYQIIGIRAYANQMYSESRASSFYSPPLRIRRRTRNCNHQHSHHESCELPCGIQHSFAYTDLDVA